MANEYVRLFLTNDFENKNRIIIKYHFTPIGLAIIRKNKTESKRLYYVSKLESLHIAGGVQPQWLIYSSNINTVITLLYNTAILLC